MTIPKNLMRKSAVLGAAQISSSKMYSDIANGKFPAPIKNGRASLWVMDEINEWVENRIAERNDKINKGGA